MRLGLRLNSSVLERGIILLSTLQNITMDQIPENPEIVNGFKDHYRMVDWSSQKIRIDISDPLNLKLSWPLKSPKFQLGLSEMPRSVTLTIQMGNKNLVNEFVPSKIFFQ